MDMLSMHMQEWHILENILNIINHETFRLRLYLLNYINTENMKHR